MTKKPRLEVRNRKKPSESLAEYERAIRNTPKAKLKTKTYIVDVVVDPHDARAFLDAFDESRPPKARRPRRRLKFSVTKVRDKRSVDALKLVRAVRIPR